MACKYTIIGYWDSTGQTFHQTVEVAPGSEDAADILKALGEDFDLEDLQVVDILVGNPECIQATESVTSAKSLITLACPDCDDDPERKEACWTCGG